jgi:NADH:ubiquinone oxidoreductase subunit C
MPTAFEPIATALEGQVTKGKKYQMVSVKPLRIVEACKAVSSLPGFYHLSTITAVDVGKEISVYYHFWLGREFLVVRVNVPKDNPSIPSVTGELPAATLYESEVADLFGVRFEGNPLSGRKLLLPDNYPKEAPPPMTKEANPEKIRKMMGLE